MAGVGVGVIRCPGVVDGDPAVAGQDTAGVDRFAAAAPVHVQQREARGASGMQPVEFAGDAESGLIEVDQFTTTELVADGVVNPPAAVSDAAARVVTAATVPSDTGTPRRSDMACAVRALDKNWPWQR